MFPVQLSAGDSVLPAQQLLAIEISSLLTNLQETLDPKTTWEIKILKTEGHKTILITTHNVDIVNSFKNGFLLLKRGKIKDQRDGKYEL